MKYRRWQSGFILSMEAVLLFSILGIGLLVGVVILRDALIKYYVTQQDSRFIIADSSEPPRLVGNVAGFDEHEAPLVVFVDYHDEDSNPLPNGFNFRTLIGIRDDRLTTRQAAFYSAPGCAGPPVCIAAPGSEAAHMLISDLTTTSGTISFLNALQGVGPAYAIGRHFSLSGSKDLLFRSTSGQCNVELLSMWVSQQIAAPEASSCINISAEGITGTALSEFRLAQPVLVPGQNENVLEKLQPPFYTNMIGNPLHEFTSTPP